MQYIVDWLLLAVAIAGISFTYIQIRHNAQTSRARFLADMHNRIVSDNDIKNIFQRIDWGNFEYDSNNFPNSNDERSLDRLLFTLDLMCMFYYQRKLQHEDIEVFEYEIHRLNQSNGVREYFHVLNENVSRFQISRHPFANFLRYSRERLGDDALPG